MTEAKKDFWDKFGKVSTFISTVIIAIAGVIITETFKEKQNKRDSELRKVEILEKFIPHLSSGDSLKYKTSILAIYSLGLDSLAIQLASFSEKKEGTEALVQMYTEGSKKSSKELIEKALIHKAEQGEIEQKIITHKVFKGYHWVLDNAHGVNSANKYSPEYEPGKRINEGQLSRMIVKKLSSVLDKKEVPHTILVTEPEEIPLKERVGRVNNLQTQKPRILLSIHANRFQPPDGNNWTKIEGIEIYNSPGTTKADNLSKVFLQELIKATGAKDRGVREARFYLVLKTNIPTIQIEIGYMDNREELRKLLSEDYQQKIDSGLVKAIEKIDLIGLK